LKLHARPIVILGMQRSGTSALAGALSRLGVFFGPEEMLYQADANNPQGFFEHRKLTVLNLRCLEAFQMHPISYSVLPPDWKAHPSVGAIRTDLRDFLKQDFARRGRWGLKQPLSSLVLPLYRDVFEELGLMPRYVICIRNPLETMQSEAKLDFGDSYRVMASLGTSAIGSWLRYTLGSFADTEGCPLTVVEYERLLKEPKSILKQLVDRDEDWQPAEADFMAAESSISGKLRHNVARVSDLDGFPPIVRRTYESAVSFSDQESDPWNALLALHTEFLGWVEMLSDFVVLPARLGLSWEADGSRKVVEVGYPDGLGWQTIRVTIDAPPKTLVSGLLHPLPYRAWIEKAVWSAGSSRAPAVLQPGLASVITQEGPLLRLEGVYEPGQIRLTTPGFPGPYELEIRFLIETGQSISASAGMRIAALLDERIRSSERRSG